MWPVQLNTTDLYTDYQRRGIYTELRRPRRNRPATNAKRIARPLRRTGVSLIRLAERFES